MAACLPYWLEFGPQNTGLVSLLTDPSSHLIAREESFKLATVTPFFKLYRIGASFSGLAIVFLWMEFFAQSRVRRLFSLFSILLLTLASNINGSRGGFLTPSLVSFYSLYICNFHSWRDISVATLYELKKGLVIKELISTTVRLIAICGLIFSFLVLISIRRTGRVADTVLAYDFVDSLIQRFFAVRFETGVMNIEAIKSLLLGPLDYIGGFPGAGMIFGERESIFMLTGRYFSLTNLGFDNATNLNTSGLFLNVGVWHFLGLIIFVSNILFNVVLFGKYALAFASSPKQILFSAVAWGWLLSTISFNIIEGELASFSTWLLFPFLMYGISKV
jgi:hypothetical protein